MVFVVVGVHSDIYSVRHVIYPYDNNRSFFFVSQNVSTIYTLRACVSEIQHCAVEIAIPFPLPLGTVPGQETGQP